MKSARSCSAALLVACALAAPPAALAESPEATALFNEGRKLLENGDIAAACDKFEASDALDRQVGTELNLADCRERNGQLATAWATFLKAAGTAKQREDKRETLARNRARTLEKQLVTLTIRVPADADIDGLVVKRNNTVIPRGGWNDPVPVDPDEYTISAEAPGRKPWSETILIKSKNKIVEVPELDRADRKGRRKRAPEPQDLPNENRGLAITLGATGLGLTVIATGFAIYSQSVEDRADALCPMVSCADAHAVDLNHTARIDGWIANIGWTLGAASLAGAGIAWWLGDRSAPDAVSIVPVVRGDGGGLAVGGHF